MSVIFNWLGAEFLFTPPCSGAPSARPLANIDPSAAAPATRPKSPRRVTPGLGSDIDLFSSGINGIPRQHPCQFGAKRGESRLLARIGLDTGVCAFRGTREFD